MIQVQCPVCRGKGEVETRLDEGLARHTDGTLSLGKEVSYRRPCQGCNGSGWIRKERYEALKRLKIKGREDHEPSSD